MKGMSVRLVFFFAWTAIAVGANFALAQLDGMTPYYLIATSVALVAGVFWLFLTVRKPLPAFVGVLVVATVLVALNLLVSFQLWGDPTESSLKHYRGMAASLAFGYVLLPLIVVAALFSAFKIHLPPLNRMAVGALITASLCLISCAALLAGRDVGDLTFLAASVPMSGVVVWTFVRPALLPAIGLSFAAAATLYFACCLLFLFVRGPVLDLTDTKYLSPLHGMVYWFLLPAFAVASAALSGLVSLFLGHRSNSQ